MLEDLELCKLPIVSNINKQNITCSVKGNVVDIVKHVLVTNAFISLGNIFHLDFIK